MALLTLPDEILLYIADIAAHRLLAHACGRLRGLLSYRHLALRSDKLDAALLVAGDRIRSLSCCLQRTRPGAHHLHLASALLPDTPTVTPHLQHLSLQIHHEGDLAGAFAMIRACSCLETLQIGVATRVNVSLECPPLTNTRLHSLRLGLAGLCLDYRTVGVLMTTLFAKHNPALRRVSIDMRNNRHLGLRWCSAPPQSARCRPSSAWDRPCSDRRSGACGGATLFDPRRGLEVVELWLSNSVWNDSDASCRRRPAVRPHRLP